MHLQSDFRLSVHQAESEVTVAEEDWSFEHHGCQLSPKRYND